MQSGEETSSPRSRVKFLCSHGGKILPRPSDGQLKYVGGETRVVAVPRNITFAELMKKLISVFEANVILRYQMMPEDLDALITVTGDDDLVHMFDEYDRHDGRLLSAAAAPPRLRAFLFPSSPVVVPTPPASIDASALEQRYIDAINGVVRTPAAALHSGSPPMSMDAMAIRDQSDQMSHRLRNPGGGMHRVRSSPSLMNLGGQAHHNQAVQHHHHHQMMARLGLPHLVTGPVANSGAVQVAPSQVKYYRQHWAPQDAFGVMEPIEDGRPYNNGGMAHRHPPT